MTRTSNDTALLYSPLSADPDLAEVVELFVQEMPDRVANLLKCVQASDWDSLRRAAHQLKGAAGSYGFMPITPAAARVEDAIRQSSPEAEILQAVDELVHLCHQARSGVPK